MKLRVFVIAALVLLVAIGGGLYFLVSSLDSLVADAIESNGSEVTSTDVGVSGVSIELREGRGSVSGLIVASPEGFDTGDAFSLGDITIDLDVSSVRSDPIVIEEVRVRAPVVRAEFTETGMSNLDALRRNIEAYRTGGDTGGDGGPAKRIRIERFVFEEGRIEADASALGIESRTITLPRIDLSNVGGSGGAPPDAIAKEILGAATRQALEQLARSELEGLLEDHLGESLGDKARGLLDKIDN